MQEIADVGTKVLHNRCVQIDKKFNCNIIAKSTFSEDGGTIICQKIETKDSKQGGNIYQKLLENNIIPEEFENKNNQAQVSVGLAEETKILELLERKYPDSKVIQSNIVRLSVVRYGIT